MEILNNKTVKSVSKRTPMISIRAMVGVFSISLTAAKRMKCKPGDAVSFAQIDDKFFIRKDDNEDGFMIRPKPGTGGQFNNKAVAERIVGNSVGNGRFLVAIGKNIEGVMYHELIRMRNEN